MNAPEWTLGYRSEWKRMQKRRRRFHDAPPGAWVSEEGWLIVGDEAWTLTEWNGRPDKAKYAIRYKTETERQQARLRSKREYARRKRAA